MQVAAVQRDSAHRVTDRQRLHYLSGEPGGFDARSVTLLGASERFSAALQWDEYGIREAEGDAPARFGKRRRLNIVRLDSVAPLRSNPSVLEMSDVLPILVPEETPTAAARGEVPLGLYFEVYHLAYDADDRTRYTVEYETVEYEVARREEGGLFRLFRDKNNQTATKATYTSSSRKAREYLALDLKKWDREGTLRVTVRLADEVSGQEAKRTVTFDALSSGE